MLRRSKLRAGPRRAEVGWVSYWSFALLGAYRNACASLRGVDVRLVGEAMYEFWGADAAHAVRRLGLPQTLMELIWARKLIEVVMEDVVMNCYKARSLTARCQVR